MMERDTDALPRSFWSNRAGRLIERGQKCGVVVQLLGGERYLLADERGRAILKSATYDECESYFYARGIE